MQKLDAISNWIKSNPVILFASVLVGALTTISGLFSYMGGAISPTLKMLNRPDCFTYADVYHNAWVDFKREGKFWREYPRQGGGYRYEFVEAHRTRDNIDLLNLTPRPEHPGWDTMMVRLPVCGGTAKVTIGITQQWEDLYEVWRD